MTNTERGMVPMCRNCDGNQWVCENHMDRPWEGTSNHPEACDCGAGAPCPVCNSHMANAALISYLGVFLGHDDRFQIQIGGNPNVVDKKLEEMRRAYDFYTSDAAINETKG